MTDPEPKPPYRSALAGIVAGTGSRLYAGGGGPRPSLVDD